MHAMRHFRLWVPLAKGRIGASAWCMEAIFACISVIQQGDVMQLNVKAPVLALAAGQILTLDDAADRIERPSIAPVPLEPHPELMPPDYRVFQLRHRIQTLYY